MQLFFIGLTCFMVLLICFAPLFIHARNRRRMRTAEYRRQEQDFERRRARVEERVEEAYQRMI